MNTGNSVYELQIIKKAIANHLDRTLPSDANQALYLIQYQIDDLVWNIATSIYRQSGYKVDFSLIRDLTNARIDSLKILALRQAEEARQKALEEEARKIEQARLKAEAEARRKAEEEARKTEEARLEEISKAKAKGVYWSKIKADSNIYLFREVFEEIKKIVAEKLKTEPDRITPDTDTAIDLGADGYDLYEISLEIEEEFGIELEEEFIGSGCSYSFFRALSSSDKYSDNYSSYRIKDLCDFIILNI